MPKQNGKRWLFVKEWQPDHLSDSLKLLSKYERWRRVAKILKLSKVAKTRLEWIIYHLEDHSVQDTCRHFVIARKTLYKWFNVFDEDNIYSLKQLEDRSRAPKHVRQKEITAIKTQRVVALKRERIRYGKIKIAKIYKEVYGEKISSWKVQGVIQAKGLHYHPKKNARTQKRRIGAAKKKRITDLKLNKLSWYQKQAGYIICLDTIVIHWAGLKRYIFTAIDKYGKVAFARMYKTKSTLNSRDFLYRLNYLFDGQIPRVGHDNGSEFQKYFAVTCKELGIEQYHSRKHTPKDNPECERFNQTLETEFLCFGNRHSDPQIFNQRLTEWLIEYNFRRPHATLDYQTPLEFNKVLPMYSSCTDTCNPIANEINFGLE